MRLIEPRGGIEVVRAVAVRNFGELVGDDVLVRLGLRILKGFLQLGKLFGVAADALRYSAS